LDKLQLISFKNCELFEIVISEGLLRAQKTLIIGTYNLQDIRITENHQTTSLSEVLVKLLKRNVQVLIILAAFMQRSHFIQTLQMNASQLSAFENIRIRFCRRMHFKTIIVDLKYAYIGTANLSGAGVGLKSLRKRNFELGFVTYDTGIIADIASTFMEVFNGKYCTSEGCHFFKNAHLEESCKGITWNQV